MSAIRILFIVMVLLIGVGIWFTGYQNVHWFLYFPPAALLFAGITGICPGYMVFRKIGFKGQDSGTRI